MGGNELLPHAELLVAPKSDQPATAQAPPSQQPVGAPPTQLVAPPPTLTPTALEATTQVTMTQSTPLVAAPPPTALDNPELQLPASMGSQWNQASILASVPRAEDVKLTTPVQSLQMMSTNGIELPKAAAQVAALPDAFSKWRQAAHYQEQFV